MSIRAQAKAAQPYLIGAVDITLDVLKDLSGTIPIPYVATAVAAACKVLEVAEVRHCCPTESQL